MLIAGGGVGGLVLEKAAALGVFHALHAFDELGVGDTAQSGFHRIPATVRFQPDQRLRGGNRLAVARQAEA